MADKKLSAIAVSNPRGTPDRANDLIYVVNNGAQYGSTVNNELGITGNPVGTTDSQTLTNKTLTSPTITAPVLSGTITGTYTLGGTPTFPTTVVTTTGTQTLTNKTLTSPTITSPTITNASITADAISGFTTANTGTIYGLPIAAGAVSGSNITAGTVGATQLSTSAILLGIATLTATFNASSTAQQDVTGLSKAVTIPSGGRSVEIEVMLPQVFSSVDSCRADIFVFEDTTQIQVVYNRIWSSANGGNAMRLSVVRTPSAGSHTYKVQIATGVGTGLMSVYANTTAGVVAVPYIAVKAI